MAKTLAALATILILMCIFATHQHAHAANHYVLAGATGNHDGSDWTNAFTELPAELVRGDTYYIADGQYPGYVFDDAESGDHYIIIKKATISSHGSDIGWDSSYGDEQAGFNTTMLNIYEIGLRFRTGYYIFDGVTGSGDDPTLYGFKIAGTTATQQQLLLGLPMMGDSTRQIDHISILHTAIICTGKGNGTYQHIGIFANAGEGYESYKITIANNYFYNATANLSIHGLHDWIIRDNYFAGNWSSEAFHGEQISSTRTDNVSLHNNIFINSVPFAWGPHNSGDPENPGVGNNDWKVYNNIVIGNGTELPGAFSTAESAETDCITNSYFHHNTFINAHFGRGPVFVGNLSDVETKRSYAYNNLFYNCNSPRLDNLPTLCTPNAIVHDHNAYLKCTGTINSADETSPQRDDDATDPFVDSAAEDFRLKPETLPINNGKTGLGPVYAHDFDGVLRDARPDIGAYEYVEAADAIPPAAPAGLKVE